MVITNYTMLFNARRQFENELFRAERNTRDSLGHVTSTFVCYFNCVVSTFNATNIINLKIIILLKSTNSTEAALVFVAARQS